MTISLIVAVSDNGVIGVQNKLPWHIPEDLKRFKALTLGHPIIMGRKTFESIGRPLPGRSNLVISRQNYSAEGTVPCTSLEDACLRGKALPGGDEIFIIGGAEIYRQSLETVQRIYMTRVHLKLKGDAHFPDLDWSLFKLTEATRIEATQNCPSYTFELFLRKTRSNS